MDAHHDNQPTFVCVCVCVCLCTCLRTCVSVYIHTHTRTQTRVYIPGHCVCVCTERERQTGTHTHTWAAAMMTSTRLLILTCVCEWVRQTSTHAETSRRVCKRTHSMHTEHIGVHLHDGSQGIALLLVHRTVVFQCLHLLLLCVWGGMWVLGCVCQ
jgi:hypothetical protein